MIIEEFPAGSIVLDLDASWNLGDIPRRVLYPRLSNAGVTVVSLLHDVLPVTHPDWFDPNLARVFVDHVDAALAHADVVVTSSRFSAGELLRLADDRPRDRRRGPLAIEVIPLGADPVRVHPNLSIKAFSTAWPNGRSSSSSAPSNPARTMPGCSTPSSPSTPMPPWSSLDARDGRPTSLVSASAPTRGSAIGSCGQPK